MSLKYSEMTTTPKSRKKLREMLGGGGGHGGGGGGHGGGFGGSGRGLGGSGRGSGLGGSGRGSGLRGGWAYGYSGDYAGGYYPYYYDDWPYYYNDPAFYDDYSIPTYWIGKRLIRLREQPYYTSPNFIYERDLPRSFVIITPGETIRNYPGGTTLIFTNRNGIITNVRYVS